MKIDTLINFYDKLNPVLQILPKKLLVKISSLGRDYFIAQLINTKISTPYIPSEKLAMQMWGLKFRAPISNAAGMFKNGDGYDIVANLGAGAYIGGTSTSNPRPGNNKHGISKPFIPLHGSHAALNWLGLPNLGDEVLYKKSFTQNKIPDCPIGWSLMRSSDYAEEEGMQHLIKSLWLYNDNPQIDFLEINESCPNIKVSGASITPRLEKIAREFLNKRQRHLPVVVKLSPDLSIESLHGILKDLIRLNFDGVNIGNTSTNYLGLRNSINASDLQLFDYFTQSFGGGVSGEPLKLNSLQLCSEAVEFAQKLNPTQEFHVIRTGGIGSFQDLQDSLQNGISFNHWYTGFFTQFHIYREQIYRYILNE